MDNAKTVIDQGRDGQMIRMRRAGKRRTLTGQISTIVLVLILVGLMEAGAAYTMLEWYHAQVSELEYTISDIYLSETDQNFNLINTSIRSMLHDGNEVLDVLKSYYLPVDYAAEVERLAYILGKNNSVIQLKNAFADMVIYYGSRFNFSSLIRKTAVSGIRRRRVCKARRFHADAGAVC